MQIERYKYIAYNVHEIILNLLGQLRSPTKTKDIQQFWSENVQCPTAISSTTTPTVASIISWHHLCKLYKLWKLYWIFSGTSSESFIGIYYMWLGLQISIMWVQKIADYSFVFALSYVTYKLRICTNKIKSLSLLQNLTGFLLKFM